MRILFSIVALTILSFSASAQTELVAKLTDVKLFYRSSELTYEVKGELPKGSTSVRVSGVSIGVDYNQAPQVLLSGATLIAAGWEPIPNVNTAAVRKYEDSIYSLLRKIHQSEKKKVILENERVVLDGNQLLGDRNKGVQPAELANLITLNMERIRDIDGQIASLTNQIKSWKNLIEVQIEGRKKVVEAITKYLPIKIQLSSNGGSFTAKIKVNTPLSYWLPVYDLKKEAGSADLQVEMRAQISQMQTEPWEDVNVILATTDPTENGKSFDQMGRIFVSEINDATIDQDYYDRSRFQSSAVEIPINGKRSFKASSELEEIKVKTIPVKASYQMVLYPLLEQKAYFVANVVNWGEYNFLSDDFNVFLDGSKMGSMTLNRNSTSDTLMIPLGKNPQVFASKKYISKNSKKNLLSGTRTYTVEIDIEVKNNQTTPAEIVLYDQVPVAENKEQEVKIKEVSGATVEEFTNILSWKFVLKPGESKKVRVSYTLTAPKNVFVQFP